jgi:hypothetical protein
MFVSFFYLLMIFLVWFRFCCVSFRFISVSFLVLQSPASQGIIRHLFIAKYNAYVRKGTCNPQNASGRLKNFKIYGKIWLWKKIIIRISYQKAHHFPASCVLCKFLRFIDLLMFSLFRFVSVVSRFVSLLVLQSPKLQAYT